MTSLQFYKFSSASTPNFTSVHLNAHFFNSIIIPLLKETPMSNLAWIYFMYVTYLSSNFGAMFNRGLSHFAPQSMSEPPNTCTFSYNFHPVWIDVNPHRAKLPQVMVHTEALDIKSNDKWQTQKQTFGKIHNFLCYSWRYQNSKCKANKKQSYCLPHLRWYLPLMFQFECLLWVLVSEDSASRTRPVVSQSHRTGL